VGSSDVALACWDRLDRINPSTIVTTRHSFLNGWYEGQGLQLTFKYTLNNRQSRGRCGDVTATINCLLPHDSVSNRASKLDRAIVEA
jgi:hypothetical protein